MSTQKDTQELTQNAKTSGSKAKGFSDMEQAAMKERARELKAEARLEKDRAAGEQALLEKIAEMPEPDQSMARKVHAIITATAPSLSPKTWYGMPAYARDGKVVCFFQSGHKYNTRYCTLGFNDAAHLDDASMWPTGFALKEVTATEEAKIAALVKKAVS